MNTEQDPNTPQQAPQPSGCLEPSGPQSTATTAPPSESKEPEPTDSQTVTVTKDNLVFLKNSHTEVVASFLKEHFTNYPVYIISPKSTKWAWLDPGLQAALHEEAISCKIVGVTLETPDRQVGMLTLVSTENLTELL